MAKYCLKKPSKRLSCAKRHKVEKKVREHNKKQRREAKKKGGNRSKAVKMINVPNKFPFKEEILAQAEQRRAELKEEKQQKKLVVKANQKLQKQKAKAIKSAATDSEPVKATNGVPSYFVAESDLVDTQTNASANKNVKAFSAEVRKTIESADVIIEVLDARDPLGSRSRRLEELVISQGKRLVLLLNKIDLVPKENVLEWLAYLRNLPTIAFKSSTQEQNKKLSRYLTANLHSNTSKCNGADLVMKLLSNYCRNKDIKTSIRVGIVGFPNVGKSSVINSLKRKKACNSGSVPGLTRQMQEVELNKLIRLIDSPGVVLATKEDEFDATELALRNALRVESLADPELAVSAILRRCSVKVLMLHYNLPEFDSCESFLALMARRLGKLRKGGRPDSTAAAKHVLNDWNCGKLRYHTKPPEKDESATSEILSSEIVSSFSKEFDIDALQGDIKAVVEEVPDTAMAVDTVYDPSLAAKLLQNGGNADDEEENDEVEKMDDGENDKSRTVVTGRVAKKRSKLFSRMAKSAPVLPDSMEIDGGNAQLNKAINVALKKHKKRQTKLASRADKLADTLSSSKTLENTDANMDYDFSVLTEE